jgi:hypothetical protein
MNRKLCLIVGAVLVVAAFLLGFVPQYLKSRDRDSQLSAVRQQLDSEREKSQMDELALLSGHVYLEADIKNYGLASQYSSKLFDQARAMMSQARGSNRQAFLQEMLAQRDSVTGGLAKGDPSTVSAVRNLFRRALENAQIGLK